MDRNIKLIWDFRGPSAAKIAEHHEKHLKEYIAMEAFEMNITGYQHVNNVLSYAFMVSPESKMIVLRDALKPHRAEVYEADEIS